MGDTLVNDADGFTGDLARLMSGEHHDPHRVLRRHEADGNKVIRALRPSATAMRVLVPDGGRVDMERVHEGGLFSVAVPGAADEYRINTGAEAFGGSAATAAEAVSAAGAGSHGFDHSAELTLPPLGVVWLCPDGQ